LPYLLPVLEVVYLEEKFPTRVFVVDYYVVGRLTVKLCGDERNRALDEKTLHDRSTELLGC
jgi:hypothetical protein